MDNRSETPTKEDVPANDSDTVGSDESTKGHHEDISKLTKRELLDLIPDEIKKTTTQSDLKRLTKQELLALIDTILDQN